MEARATMGCHLAPFGEDDKNDVTNLCQLMGIYEKKGHVAQYEDVM